MTEDHQSREELETFDNRYASWWRTAILYQIYPRSLQDGDGDGVGDLRGLIKRLPQIKALGVTCLWISPFFRSPMKDFGYDVEDHCDVDPLFGDLEIARDLVRIAHQLDLKIMIDLVISHTSDRHPWFQESRQSAEGEKSDYYVWADAQADGSPPNNWLSIFGGSAWKWESRRRQYYLHNFLVSQPDLNFHNRSVQDGVLEVARFWLDLGVDGFRLDTVNFYFHDQQLRNNPPALVRDGSSAPESNPYGWQDHQYDKNQPEVVPFLRRLRSLLDQYSSRVALGEIGEAPERSLDLLVRYTQPDALHLCYSFDLLGEGRTAQHFRNVIARFEEKCAASGGESWPCWAFSNHDVERVATRLCPQGGSPDETARLSLALLLAMRGTPCIYQGEELGLGEAEVPFDQLVDPYGIEFWPDYKGRDGCRTPYPWERSLGGGFTETTPWLPLSAQHLERAHQAQFEEPDSVLNIARRLIQTRLRSPALHSGSLLLIESDPELLIFKRTFNHDTMICAFNPSVDTRSWSSPEEVSLLVARHVELREKALTIGAQGWAYLEVK